MAQKMERGRWCCEMACFGVFVQRLRIRVFIEMMNLRLKCCDLVCNMVIVDGKKLGCANCH